MLGSSAVERCTVNALVVGSIPTRAVFVLNFKNYRLILFVNILIPMGGLGSRFSKSHPGQLKPLIDVCGKTMLERVINNFNQLKDITFIIVTSKIIGVNANFVKILKKSNLKYRIILIDNLTQGPACTCLLAKQYIKNNDPLIITNCDQIIMDFNLNFLTKFADLNGADGVIGTFHSNSNKNSYVKLGEDLRIQEIKEKIVISNIATNGLHFWAKGNDFVRSALQMISLNDKYSNEFYVAPTYNYLIKEGKKILPYYYNLHFPIGVPEDLNFFTEKVYENFKD